MPRVLVVEDERVLAKNVREKLTAHGHEVAVAGTGKEALAANVSFMPDVVILDVRLPDADGIQLLPRLKADAPSVSVVVVTAHGNEKIAVEAMKAGAAEYLTKPVDLDELLLVVDRLAEQAQISNHLAFLRTQEKASSDLDRIIGESEAIRNLKETIRRLARAEVLGLPDPPTVLITGETGTGKDLAARAIHYQGPRSKKPFIHVNCTALPATLFESELFGHLRGAFTSAASAKQGLFEVAEGGTIFLDEIGHLDMDMQSKLLHAIERREIRPIGATQARPINVHIIAATNRNLDEAVEAGEFRRDLYHRLRVIQIHLAPLRDRREDIPILANHFLTQHCRRFGMPLKRFAESALSVIRNHAWRGNVRELSHFIESLVLQVDAEVIEAEDLPIAGDAAEGNLRLEFSTGQVITVDFEKGEPKLDEIEHALLSAAFEYTGQNLSRAARILGITREALRYRLHKAAETAPQAS